MWRVLYTPSARKDLDSLDPQVIRRILLFVDRRLVGARDPRLSGEPLHGPLKKYWKYRVGEYRIVCLIEDEAVTVVVVRVGHRRAVYR